MNLVPRQWRHKYFVHFPIWFLFLQFSAIIFKGNETPESAPDRQVFKIKPDESEYRTQGTSIR